MESLSPTAFFDVTPFFHNSIFHQCRYAWEALPKISAFLEEQELGRIDADIPQGAYLISPELISIGYGTVIEPGVYIKGPCIIGQNCSVRHGAYLRGNVLAGDKCILGHDSEFKNAILMNGACAAHFAYVGDSILGNRVNLGAGTICANLRLDRGSIAIRVNGEHIQTGLRKFGAILGDDVQIGCHAVTNPGTLLGKEVICYPGINFGGFVPQGAVIREERTITIA